MNCAQAETISIHEYLTSLGYAPIAQRHKQGDELRYHSPIRSNDKTPSFDVNIKKNCWNDQGLGTGGGIIQLVQQLYKASVKEALAILDQSHLYRGEYQPPNEADMIFYEPSSTQHKTATKGHNEFNQLTIKKVKALTNKALVDYVASRGINQAIAAKYLQEVYYTSSTNPDKTLFALAWPNDSGSGYEARNILFKGFVGKTKTITSINLKKGQKLAVFEGFMDFLSYLTYFGLNDFQSSAIVLNSTSLKNEAIDIIRKIGFSDIYLFLDNDAA